MIEKNKNYTIRNLLPHTHTLYMYTVNWLTSKRLPEEIGLKPLLRHITVLLY